MNRLPLLKTAFLFFYIFQPFFFSVGQEPNNSRQVAAGKRYLNSKRLANWERTLRNAPLEMGRIEYHAPTKMLSQYWKEQDFYLAKFFYESDPVVYSIAIKNKQYGGSIQHVSGKYQVLSVANVSGPDQSRRMECTLIPFALPSSVGFTNEIIPVLLQDEVLVIHDYRQEANKHFFQLVFTDESGREPIDLVFDDEVPSPLPVETTFRDGDEIKKLTSFDFTDIKGFVIPLKFSEVKNEDEKTKFIIETRYFPEDRLNRDSCYFSYYDLSEPDSLKVTDFGRKRSNRSLIAVIVIAVMLVIFFFIRRFSRE